MHTTGLWLRKLSNSASPLPISCPSVVSEMSLISWKGWASIKVSFYRRSVPHLKRREAVSSTLLSVLRRKHVHSRDYVILPHVVISTVYFCVLGGMRDGSPCCSLPAQLIKNNPRRLTVTNTFGLNKAHRPAREREPSVKQLAEWRRFTTQFQLFRHLSLGSDRSSANKVKRLWKIMSAA